MNVGLVKGCLKTELLSVFWHYSKLNHSRPQSFSFHDLLYAVAYLPKLTVQDGLRDTVCTGTSSTGCHGAVYLGIHISKVAKLDARVIKTFCIPSMHGQNHEMATELVLWDAGAVHRWDALEHQALWHLPKFRAGCTCPLLPQYLQGSLLCGQKNSATLAQGVRAPVLKCAREAHTWMRTCFHLTQGFLVTFIHKQLSATKA